MDSASGSDSTHSVQWNFLGEKVPRAEIVYFAQLFLCFTLIVTSIVMLALKDSNRDLWMVTLSSVMGYIMPSPQMGTIKQPKPAAASSVHHG
jgi:hypothetical protein